MFLLCVNLNIDSHDMLTLTNNMFSSSNFILKIVNTKFLSLIRQELN